MQEDDARFVDPVMEAELCSSNNELLGLCTEAADFMNMAESLSSNAGHGCFDQSSISDSIGNLASGS